jgi:hypothetical protein
MFNALNGPKWHQQANSRLTTPNQTRLQRRADVRARGENSGYGQPKGGRKGGLFPSIIINTLICNIFMMDYGAPTRQN